MGGLAGRRLLDPARLAPTVFFVDRAAPALVEYELVKAVDQSGHPVYGPDSSGHFSMTPMVQGATSGRRDLVCLASLDRQVPGDDRVGVKQQI
jgi:hypothetical protein